MGSLLAAFALLGSGCGGDPVDINLTVTLNNTATAPYFLWIGHGSKPAGALQQGGFSQTEVVVRGKVSNKDSPNTNVFNDNIKVNAAKADEGNTVTQSLQLSGLHVPGKPMNIRWDGKGFSLEY